MKFWTPEQLRQFLESVGGERLDAAWHLAAMTGMRRGEVLGVRWRDIDLEGERLSVRQAVIVARRGIRIAEPKNGMARVIDLDSGTMSKLQEHRHRQETERAEWGSEYEDLDLVFCRENGTPCSPHGFTAAFVRLSGESGLPRIRLHDLRHTHATIAIKAGVPVTVIAERLGHYSPGFTLKQYAHVIPGMQAEAAAAIRDLIFASPRRA